jgi:hypothetical protein
MLCVDLIHRHFEHIVTADADAMNLHRSLLAWLRLFLTVRLMDVLCMTHGRILTRTRKLHSYSNECSAT